MRLNIKSNWNIEDILTVSLINGINNVTLREIVSDFNSFDELINSGVRQNYKITGESLFGDTINIPREGAQKQIKFCFDQNISIISLWDDIYPELLREINYPPALLFVKGELVPNAVSISIVGTRICTQYGKLATERFAEFFARNNIVVTSGLANGVDSLAHMTTVKNNGITYAVIASGIDCLSSSESRKNADKIINSGGAVISEYICGTKTQTAYFPQRNRIISGISKATIIIESDIKGGSLITARFAFDQQREVFAVPGSIFSEKSRGTNKLILDNLASPAVSPDSVLERLGISRENTIFSNQIDRSNFDELDIKLFSFIDHEPIHIDDLFKKMNIEMSSLLVKLLELEFKGSIRQLPGKHYIKQ